MQSWVFLSPQIAQAEVGWNSYLVYEPICLDTWGEQMPLPGGHKETWSTELASRTLPSAPEPGLNCWLKLGQLGQGTLPLCPHWVSPSPPSFKPS